MLIRSQDISTHSLTKRLTIKGPGSIEYGFISTHSLTKRLTMTGAVGYTQAIISTHSLTKRLTVCRVLTEQHPGYFNSQPHEEADVDGRLKDDNLKTFQLTASRRG